MSRRLLYIAFIILLATLVAGCFGGGTPNPNTSRITGTVTDVAHSPLKGATIVARSQVTTSLADGTFRLAVPPGDATLTVTKSGFNSYSQQLSVPAAGVAVGDVVLTQSIPEYGGGFQGSTIFSPSFVDGTATFTLNAPDANSRSLVMLFPQAEGASYEYHASFEPVGSVTPRILSTRRALEPPSSTLPLALLFNPPRSHEADRHMRESEKRAPQYRSAILSLQRRARSLNPSLDLTLGRPRFFKVIDWETETYVTIEAQLRGVGQHALMYVKRGDNVTDSQVQSLLAFFDQKQPVLVRTFGDELDVDGNGKTIILLTPMPDPLGTLFGYFDWSNELSVSDNPDSNQADMIYINSQPLATDFSTVEGTLAHEYQHLLHFSSRITNGSATSDAWIDEGFAVLAEDLAGLGFAGGDLFALAVVSEWLDNTYSLRQNWSLTSWGYNNVDYGGDYLFARYFFDQYGPNGVLQVNRSAYGGLKALTDVTGGSFGEIDKAFLASVAYASYKMTPEDPRIGFDTGFSMGGTLWGWSIPYDTPMLDVRRVLGGPPLTIPGWGMDSFSVNGGGPGAQVKVTLTTQPGDNFAAIVVTGLHQVSW